MTHNITPVDAFTTPVVVPDGTDSHTTLAEFMEAFVQALTNRTHYLNLHAALKTAANVFTAAPQEVSVNDAELAALVQRKTCRDDAEPGNLWKNFLGANVGGDTGYVNIYAGDAAGEAQFIIAINAVWSTADQEWSQDDPGSDSYALLFHQVTGLRTSKKSDHSSPWATWPTDAGGDITLGGDLTASAALLQTCNAVFGFTVPATGDYSYSPVRTRTSILGGGFARAGGHNGGNGALVTDGTRSFCYIDLHIPANATMGTFEAVHYQDTTTPSEFHLAERTINFASPGAASETYLVTDSGVASTGYKKASLDLSGVTFDPAKEYRIIWHPGSAGDTVEGWRMLDWQDLGPLNTL
jgi:hypothetical protein